MGWTTVWVSEIDPYASAVLKKHFPDAPNLGDITKLDGTKAPPIDMLVGGFPCQDISLAGKGVGIEGSRSGLWSHYARLIDETQPKYIVAENVSALRSRGLDRVLQDLAALGYDAEWHCVPASHVGAPHRRDRIWIVAYPERNVRGDGGSPVAPGREPRVEHRGRGERLTESEAGTSLAHPDSQRLAGVFAGGGAQRGEAAAPEGSVASVESGRRGTRSRASDVADASCELQHRGGKSGTPRRSESSDRGAGGGDLAHTSHPRLERHPRYDPILDQSRWLHPRPDGSTGDEGLREGCGPEGWWAAEPAVGRVAHGVPSRVDRLKCLGNAIVPQVAFEIFSAIERYEILAGGE
ncbi:cytosine specific methyltransferase [Caudoviricetes sp.]|nr:cytosine specific methyltransferase [Caudoviricetes sp.]